LEFEGAQLHTKASEAFDALRRYADSLYFSGFPSCAERGD